MSISSQSREVGLRGGGYLTVWLVGASWMQFGAEERALMSTIADAMHLYEQQRRREEPPSVGAVDPVAASSNEPSTRD